MKPMYMDFSSASDGVLWAGQTGTSPKVCLQVAKRGQLCLVEVTDTKVSAQNKFLGTLPECFINAFLRLAFSFELRVLQYWGQNVC